MFKNNDFLAFNSVIFVMLFRQDRAKRERATSLAHYFHNWCERKRAEHFKLQKMTGGQCFKFNWTFN